LLWLHSLGFWCTRYIFLPSLSSHQVLPGWCIHCLGFRV
jgi:hypothetical protein